MKRSREASVSAPGGGASSGLARLARAPPGASPGAGAGASPSPLALAPGEELRLHSPATRLVIDGWSAGGGAAGDLFVTSECVRHKLHARMRARRRAAATPPPRPTHPRARSLARSRRRLAWFPAPGGADDGGFSVGYRALALHAVCTDAAAYAEPCILCHLSPAHGGDCDDDGDAGGGAAAAAAAATAEAAAKRTRGDGGGAQAAGAAPPPALAAASELRLVPAAGASALDAIFAAMSAAADALPEPMDDDGGGGGGFDAAAFGAMLGSDDMCFDGAVLRAALARGGAAGAAGGAQPAPLPFSEGGWVGDPLILASFGLPAATNEPRDDGDASLPSTQNSDLARQ
jgi:hypothetical protein